LLSTACTVLPTALVTAKVLVRLGDSLRQTVGALVEGGEVAQQLQETLLVEHALEQVLQASTQMGVVDLVAELDRLAVVVDVPRREMVERRDKACRTWR